MNLPKLPHNSRLAKKVNTSKTRTTREDKPSSNIDKWLDDTRIVKYNEFYKDSSNSSCATGVIENAK